MRKVVMALAGALLWQSAAAVGFNEGDRIMFRLDSPIDATAHDRPILVASLHPEGAPACKLIGQLLVVEPVFRHDMQFMLFANKAALQCPGWAKPVTVYGNLEKSAQNLGWQPPQELKCVLYGTETGCDRYSSQVRLYTYGYFRFKRSVHVKDGELAHD